MAVSYSFSPGLVQKFSALCCTQIRACSSGGGTAECLRSGLCAPSWWGASSVTCNGYQPPEVGAGGVKEREPREQQSKPAGG